MGELRHRVCSICEAGCGLVFEVEGERIVDVRNDPADPFSGGYCCPKGLASGDLHHDPDRLRKPLVRSGGELKEASWDEAFGAAIEGLGDLVRDHGPHAMGLYLGNPVVHRLEAQIGGELVQLLVPTHNRYTANSMDAHPHLVANALVFGMQLAQPIPDLDGCHTLLILGANPLVSQGSFMIGPNAGRRLRAIQSRGGRVIVVDPRRSETARIADEHRPIRPGRDAYLLLAMAHLLAQEPGDRLFLERWTAGHEQAQAVLAPFTPERVAPRLGGGWTAAAIRDLVTELLASPAPAVYGRVGICTTDTGGVAAWALLLVNALLGSLDAPGGMMFPEGPAAWILRTPHAAGGYARWRSPQGCPETNGEYPCHILAEQIERGVADPHAPEALLGMLVVAGNPLLSAPNGPRLAEAMRRLRFLVVSDIYPSETAQLADVVLPPRSSLYEPKFDPILAQLAVADTARFSEAVLPQSAAEADQPGELELLRRLGVGISRRSGRASLTQRALRMGAGLVTAERFAALGIRFGARGKGLNPFSRGETLASLRRKPHGLEALPLQPGRLPRRLRGRDRMHLFPQVYLDELQRLAARLDETPDDGLVLIGRRRLKSNNSWFHNLPKLRGGKECTLLVHPDDAARLELTAGGQARVRSRVGELIATVQISDEMLPGVISLPHGWGHAAHGGKVASGAPGVNVNQLVDDDRYDPITGNAALNGVPVEVEACVEAAVSSRVSRTR